MCHLHPDAYIITPVSSEVDDWCLRRFGSFHFSDMCDFRRLFMERGDGASVMNGWCLWLMD